MRPKLPADIKRAIALREAGYSLATITEKTGLSASTLYRHFKKHSIERGALMTDSIEEARQQLLNDAGFLNDLKQQIAASIVDDLALVKQIRESLALSLEELTEDATTPASLKARSLAALSTTLKLTQDINRKALNMDTTDQQQFEELPTLAITKMTDEEIKAAQDRFKNEDEELVTTD